MGEWKITLWESTPSQSQSVSATFLFEAIKKDSEPEREKSTTVIVSRQTRQAIGKTIKRVADKTESIFIRRKSVG